MLNISRGFNAVEHLEQGGWISERGRFLDDPYIIAKVTPATKPRPSHLARDPLSSSSTRCSQQAERTARGIEVGGVHRSKSWQDPAHPEQSRIKDGNGGTRSSRRAAGNRHLPAASQHGHAVQPGTSNDNSQRRYHHRPPRKESGDRRPAGIAAGSSRLVPTSSSGREDAPAKGSLGLLPSPSADVLHINDSGDKVKCPVCQRGMDHWKSGQRQQVRNGDVPFPPPNRSVRWFRCERDSVGMLCLLSGMPIVVTRPGHAV